MKSDRVIPFRIDVSDEVLSDLQQRLKCTRWSYQMAGTNWDAGVDLNYLRALAAYWHDSYDWRQHETAHPICRVTDFQTSRRSPVWSFVYTTRGRG